MGSMARGARVIPGEVVFVLGVALAFPVGAVIGFAVGLDWGRK